MSRLVDRQFFKRVVCSDCKFDSGVFKWYSQQVEGTTHEFINDGIEKVDKKTCGECTRADSIRRANAVFEERTREVIEAEKKRVMDESLQKKPDTETLLSGTIFATDRDGTSTSDSRKRKHETESDDPPIMKEAKAALSDRPPPVKIDISDIQDMYWDNSKCTLVQKKSIPCEPGAPSMGLSYEFIPVSRPDPSTFVLNKGAVSK